MQQMTSDQYVEAGGTKCPACGSGEVENFAGWKAFPGGKAMQHVRCGACGCTWMDVYKLTGFDGLAKANPDDRGYVSPMS